MALTAARRFNFATDTFAYPNELVWEYRRDEATGKQIAFKRTPPPAYAQRCFVLVRTARQFFLHTKFDPTLPVADDATYQNLIKSVIRQNPQKDSATDHKIIIPGFANLREFSAAKKELLQAHCGGSWRSYLQRGNWRMVHPFNRAHQAREAGRMGEAIGRHLLPIVHIATFPSLTINHALMLFQVKENADQIEFEAYDPNIPERPTPLFFNRQTGRFSFPANHYFIGGEVKIYEIYRSFLF